MAVDPLNTYREIMAKKQSTEFIIGEDDFNDLIINEVAEISGLHYFKNLSKTFVKHFVLKRTKQIEKICKVTLIKKGEGKFEPRFELIINDLTNKNADTFRIPIGEQEEKLIKARINLADCHKEFSELLNFLQIVDGIEFQARQYAVVTADQKELLGNIINDSSKEQVIRAVAEKYGGQLTEDDIILITSRKQALIDFKKLMEDLTYFVKYRALLKASGKSSRPEDVWQHFFERHSWIFGYGLQLVACESLDNHKLETIVVGSDIFDGSGKRIDGLLKTKGSINLSLFTEIKLHDAPLLEKYDRSSVYVPGKDLRGAVAQIQKTIHKVNLKVSRNFTSIKDKEGNPTGEEIAFVQPRAVIVIGMLNQFAVENGVNDEMLSSFELYRQQLNGVDIITYDELYERTKYIVGDDK